MKRNEIYMADLSPVKGSEQGGVRPVLIIQNDVGNEHSTTTIVAPITSRQTKAMMPTHVTLTADCLIPGSIVLLEQICTIDKTRITNYIGEINKLEADKVDRAIHISLSLYKRRNK